MDFSELISLRLCYYNILSIYFEALVHISQIEVSKYLRLLGQWAGQILWRQVSRAWGGGGRGFTFGFPKWRREGGVAGEEKGFREDKQPCELEKSMLMQTPVTLQTQNKQQWALAGHIYIIIKLLVKRHLQVTVHFKTLLSVHDWIQKQYIVNIYMWCCWSYWHKNLRKSLKMDF